jgi:hypothetical protein
VADVGLGDRTKRIDEWFWRRQALDAARAQLPRRDELAGRAFEQVRLLREVAWQIAAPTEPPPAGRRAAVLLSVCRDMVYWTLIAGLRNVDERDPTLATLWERTPHEKLVSAAGSERNLKTVHELLVDTSLIGSLDATDDDVERVRAFAGALYDDLAVPRRRVIRIVGQRWLRSGAAVAALVVVVLAIRALAMGPNLASRGTMRTSSQLPGCETDPGCAPLLFHTNAENNPWVEFDLGAPTPIQTIDIGNRPDCCQDRAVPLVAEVSSDHVSWREVARKDTEFSRWKATFPRTDARYVRLRVLKHVYFGFADVAIR